MNEVGAAVAALPREVECDVVTKGGLTPGVLNPPTLHGVVQCYRIRGIGGDSAGAISAALRAAAEYGRTEGGFERVRRLPESRIVAVCATGAVLRVRRLRGPSAATPGN